MATKACCLIFSLVVLSLVAMANSVVDDVPILPFGPLVKFKVQGTISCLNGTSAIPLRGATAKVKCDVIGKHRVKGIFIKVSTPADRKGVFFLSFPSILSTGERILRCKVSLNASPLPKCNIALNINRGIDGAFLARERSRVLGDHTLLLFAKALFFSVSS